MDLTFMSGYISDYSILKKVQSPDGSSLHRFISQEMKTRGYNKLLLDPVSFYPTPPITDTQTKSTLSSISRYFNSRFRSAMAEKIIVVNEPGEQTLRMKMAITGVKITEKDLSGYQYLPVVMLSNVITGGISEAVVRVQIEVEVVDSLSGELMAAAIKSGVGETLKDKKAMLTLAKVKPLIDSWAVTMQRTIENNL